MPKSRTKQRRIDANDANALIRHHLEEASTHLGMVRKLINDSQPLEVREGFNVQLSKIGKYLKRQYVRYGGHPDA